MMLHLPPFEVLLVLGVVGFYLFDSAQLLYRNELLLHSTGSTWHVSAPSGLPLRGRYLHIPNPFAPGQLLLRLNWYTSAPALDRQALLELQRTLQPLRYLCGLLAIQLLLGLPLVLLLFRPGSVWLTQMAAIYLILLTQAVYLWQQRAALGLSRKAALMLAFEVITCPPFGLNLLRRLSLMHPLHGDSLQLLQQLLPAPAQTALFTTLQQQLAEDLQLEADDSPERTALLALQARLAQLNPAPAAADTPD
ncbi:hypothetical protein [Leeia aquatica]|nr:hypothetical protein [Leeia aquatica]